HQSAPTQGIDRDDETDGSENSYLEPAAVPHLRSGVVGDDRHHAGVTQVLPTGQILKDAEEHADSGGTEAPMPRRFGPDAHPRQDRPELRTLSEPAADQRRDESTQIDSHVEDRKTGVPSVVFLRIKLPDHRAYVRFEQTCTKHDAAEAEIER